MGMGIRIGTGMGTGTVLAAGTHLLLAVPFATRCQSSLGGRFCSLRVCM